MTEKKEEIFVQISNNTTRGKIRMNELMLRQVPSTLSWFIRFIICTKSSSNSVGTQIPCKLGKSGSW
jgi:hypothetical protein